MSEYQYYEFAALDRPLTREEMVQLRKVSSRAEITPTGFDDAELEPFLTEYGLHIEDTGEHWIFDWCLEDSENHDRFGMDDGTGWMVRLAPLREELLRGDLRPLYLGWLAAVSAGQVEDEAFEPPPPSGLATLSPAQEALVEFLEIDADLLTAAQAGSAPGVQAGDAMAGLDLDAWLAQWTREDMASVLKLIAQNRDAEGLRQVRSRLAAWLKSQRPTTAARPRRSVAELCEVAEVARGAREAQEARDHAVQQAEQRCRHEAHLRRRLFEAGPWS